MTFNLWGSPAFTCTGWTVGGYFNGFGCGITGVWRVWCNMGSSGSAFKNATFYPLPSDYRCPEPGEVIFAGSGMPSWTPTENYFRLRATICINLCRQVCSRLGIDRRMLSAFHPQSYRLTERINASMDQYLWVFINHQQDYCLKSLLLAEFAANNVLK